MHELQATFRDTVANGLRRKAITTCSKWAESYRIMGLPLPGKWTFKYHPWLRAIHDSDASTIVIAKAAQMGFTEAALNKTFYKIDIDRADCLYILPSKTPDASDFSSARFDAALELSSHLEGLFSDVKNVGHKRAGSANLYIRGSNSRSGLKSIPVAFIVFDELDEMNQDNIALAEERTSGQIISQIYKISTPTVPNKKISAEFDQSTQEHFIFECPHCGRLTELIFPDCMVITADDRLDPKVKDSHLICKECKHLLCHQTKTEWLANGHWEPFGRPDAEKRGFHVNQLYSCTQTPEKFAVKFLSSLVDKLSEQEFYNSNLGVPFVSEGAQVTDKELSLAIGSRRKADSLPEGKLITMGIDHGRWIHYEIDAWTFPKLGNDLNMSAECEVLTAGKVVDFEELGQLMRQWQVILAVIDAQPERRMAYEFACNFWGHVKLCFYSVGATGKLIQVDNNDDSHKVSVDRTAWLDVALNRFHNQTIKLPQDIGEEYKSHIKNLIKRYFEDANGNPTCKYVNMGPDHFGHARCYAEIALPLAASLTTNTNIKGFL